MSAKNTIPATTLNTIPMIALLERSVINMCNIRLDKKDKHVTKFILLNSYVVGLVTEVNSDCVCDFNIHSELSFHVSLCCFSILSHSLGR